MARRLLAVLGVAGLVSLVAGCGSTSNSQPRCAEGPIAPGERVTLAADQPFTASDVNNLTRRFYTAGATCVSVGGPGGTNLEVSEQGITGARARLLFNPGRLVFATWAKPHDRGGTPPSPLASIDSRQVARADGGTCAASIPGLECAPTGYVAVETALDGNSIRSVVAAADRVTRQGQIKITLTDSGTSTLSTITAQMSAQRPPRNQLAVLVDGTMVSNATIHSPVNNGQFDIGGGRFSDDKQYATDLATLVNTGQVTPYRVTTQSNL